MKKLLSLAIIGFTATLHNACAMDQEKSTLQKLGELYILDQTMNKAYIDAAYEAVATIDYDSSSKDDIQRVFSASHNAAHVHVESYQKKLKELPDTLQVKIQNVLKQIRAQYFNTTNVATVRELLANLEKGKLKREEALLLEINFYKEQNQLSTSFHESLTHELEHQT